MADAIGVPRTAAGPALALVGTAFLPLMPTGESFVDLWMAEVSRGLLPGLMMLIGFGSPYLFGLAAVATVWARPQPPIAPFWLIAPVALIHAQLVLVAIVVFIDGRAVATVPFLAFALLAGFYFAMQNARAHAEGGGPSLRWTLRWGATVVSGIGAWAALQRVGDVDVGFSIDAAVAAAVALIVLVSPAFGQSTPASPLGR